jgi:AraC-like DNA-binding protein
VTLPGATWERGIDLIAIQRAMTRHWPCPELTEEEQRAAERAMSEAEWSAADIAGRLGVSERTVTRWRGEEGGS